MPSTLLVPPTVRDEAEELPVLSLNEIKREIQRLAPLHFSPLPVDRLSSLETELSYRHDILELAVLPAGPSLLGRAKNLVKKTFRLALRWILMRQVEFNYVQVEHNREAARLIGLLEQNLCELFAVVTDLKKQVSTLTVQEQAARRKVRELQDDVVANRVRLRNLQAKLAAGADDANGVDAKDAYTVPPVDYFLFEMRFRGSREEIAGRQRVYLDYFRDQDKVLDVGCGRGEFVEMLLSEGITVQGVDASAEMVAFCEELGLPVAQSEATQYLNQLVDDSLGGVFIAQVVEHLTPEAVARLLSQARAALRKGGVLVVETVNPICPVAYGNFYLDPTHVRPVHPDLLRFLLESQGFTTVECVFSAPTVPGLAPYGKAPRIEDFDCSRYHDYAIVARK